MNRLKPVLAGAMLIASIWALPAFAQGTPQTISLVRVDVKSLETGYRTSKVVGASVTNEAGETIGKIDDLIVTPNDKIPYAVISVGGFLGVGTRYVVVPYTSLDIREKSMLLRGATKDSLKALPEFKYQS